MAVNIRDWKTRLMSTTSIKVSRSDFMSNFESIRNQYKNLPAESIPAAFMTVIADNITKFADVYLTNALGYKIECTDNGDIITIRKYE